VAPVASERDSAVMLSPMASKGSRVRRAPFRDGAQETVNEWQTRRSMPTLLWSEETPP